MEESCLRLDEGVFGLARFLVMVSAPSGGNLISVVYLQKINFD